MGKRKKKRDTAVCVICWCIIPVIVVILIVLDYFQIYQFTAERYALIIVLILSLIVPVVGEIVDELRVGDVSFKSKRK